MKIFYYALSIIVAFIAATTALEMSKEYESLPSWAVSEAINRAIFIPGADYESNNFKIKLTLPPCRSGDVVSAGTPTCIVARDGRLKLLYKHYRWYFFKKNLVVEVQKSFFDGKHRDEIIAAASDPCAYLYNARRHDVDYQSSERHQLWASICSTAKYKYDGVFIYLLDDENVVGRTFVKLAHN